MSEAIRRMDVSHRMVASRAMPRVSVVVPTRNRVQDLERCLECLRGQSMPPDQFEILICDDGSESSSAKEIERLCGGDARVRYLRQDPRGPAAARNMGVRAARGTIIAFTDSDTLPSRGWLAALIAPFADAEVAAVEGPVRPPEPRVSPLQDAPRSEGGVYLTANMAYRRSVLETVGGLDEMFPLPAFEDTDLALVARNEGRFDFAPEAVVIHPWRRLTLRGSFARLRQLDWLLVTALRHGCLAWVDRPTTHPRLRVALAATVFLPLGRARSALKFTRRNPRDVLLRLGYCLMESLVCLTRVPRWMFANVVIERKRFLEGGHA
ncbi:MAG: glycosyltransferase family A protein [Planctomycetota bacterium]